MKKCFSIKTACKDCDTCIQSKKMKLQNHQPSPRAKQQLEHVHMDFWGLYMRVPNPQGYHYFLSLTDDYSRCSWIYLTKDRSYETLVGILNNWIAMVERETGQKLQTI